MNILLFFIVLFVLVVVHELGHFIVAKRTGMRVDEFGVGFPPRLFGTKKGETEYTFNAFPVGGFVRIYGEDARGASARLDEDVSEQGDGNSPSSGQRRYGEDADWGRAFSNRPKWAQAAVLVAGVGANIIFAWFLFTAVLWFGTQSVVSESEATTAATLTVLSVLPDSPAAGAGIEAGDVIVGIASGEQTISDEILTPTAVSSFISSNESVTVTLRDSDATRDVSLAPARGLAEDDVERPVVGIVMGLVEETSLPIHRALWEGAKTTVFGLRDITLGIGMLFWNALFLDADLSQVAGPVGIVGLVGDAASFGVSALLTFTAFISLNLAVINLLPFPALDGGRLLFVAIEAVKGSPIKPMVAQLLNTAGFFILIALMVVVTLNDVLKIL